MPEVIQEVFSKPDQASRPIKEHDFWILSIQDWTESYRPGFTVQQGRMIWSEIDQAFICEESETDQCSLLSLAQEQYEARRRELVKKGFIHSDMDF